MLLTLTLEGVARNFNVEAGDIYMIDWSEKVEDLYDTVEKSKDVTF